MNPFRQKDSTPEPAFAGGSWRSSGFVGRFIRWVALIALLLAVLQVVQIAAKWSPVVAPPPATPGDSASELVTEDADLGLPANTPATTSSAAGGGNTVPTPGDNADNSPFGETAGSEVSLGDAVSLGAAAGNRAATASSSSGPDTRSPVGVPAAPFANGPATGEVVESSPWLSDDWLTPASERISGYDLRAETAIDKAILQPVVDNTVGLRAGEGDPYFRILAHAAQIPAAHLNRAASSQVPWDTLMESPAGYRGELIKFNGVLRRVTRLRATPNDFGVGDLYEGWVYTTDSNGHPWRVVASSLDDAISLGQTVEVPVTIVGYFFKRQGYEATTGLQMTPLVLGKQIVRLRPRAMPPVDLTRAMYALAVVIVISITLAAALSAFTLSDAGRLREDIILRTGCQGRDLAAIHARPRRSVYDQLEEFTRRSQAVSHRAAAARQTVVVPDGRPRQERPAQRQEPPILEMGGNATTAGENGRDARSLPTDTSRSAVSRRTVDPSEADNASQEIRGVRDSRNSQTPGSQAVRNIAPSDQDVPKAVSPIEGEARSVRDKARDDEPSRGRLDGSSRFRRDAADTRSIREAEEHSRRERAAREKREEEVSPSEVRIDFPHQSHAEDTPSSSSLSREHPEEDEAATNRARRETERARREAERLKREEARRSHRDNERRSRRNR